MAGQPLSYVQKHVVIDASRRGFLIASLRTTPKFRPAANPCDPSVEPGDEEFHQAPRALIRRFVRELGPGARLSVRDWIDRERGKRVNKRSAGFGELAADLMGKPLNAELRSRNDYKALKRSLERSASATKVARTEAHGGIKKPAYQQLIAKLKGGELGNPFAPDRILTFARIRNGQFQFWIRGDWLISKEQKCKTYRAPEVLLAAERYVEDAHMRPYDVIASNGGEFYNFVLGDFADTAGEDVELLREQAIGVNAYFPDERGRRL